MDSVFQELKRAREAKRLSINDVSDATLINPGFLDAIEQGKTDILPQTYVRAFIREYASVVGLDPAEIMKHYDQTLAEVAHPAPVEQPLPPPPQREIEEAPKPPTVIEPIQRTNAGAKYALPGILILALAIVIWNITRTKTLSGITETPFESTVKESTAKTDSGESVFSHATLSSLDSLTLQATINDSVWVQVIVDNLEPRQYMFRPNRKITWKAKDRFRITTGKAGAIDFTLNEKQLGTLGKRGSVRNVEFNRQTLLQK